MAPTTVDHLFAGFLVLVAPWWAVADYRGLLRALGAGQEDARTRAYRRTILVQWCVAVFVVGFWLRSGRPLSTLGLGVEASRGTWIGLALTLAACGFLVAQVVMVRQQPEARAAVRAQLERLRPLLPHTAGEGRWFHLLSVTAGICEEVAYRGFLMAYFGGLGVAAAILLSTLAFGLSHTYMGRTGALRAGLVGLVVAGLYWLTGSLWASMLLHASADVTSGLMARTSLASGASAAAVS